MNKNPKTVVNPMSDSIEVDAFLTCFKCNPRVEMEAIGEEAIDLDRTVYIYECPKCHDIHRSLLRYLKSFGKQKKPFVFR